MVEVQGTHGTCASRARSIQAQGFQLNEGRQGVGAYFWRENRFSRELATGWFKNARNLGEYNQETDRRCAVVTAIIIVQSDEWLDLNDPETTDNLLALFQDKGYQDNIYTSKLIEEYIDIVEDILENKIKLIQTRVMAPKLARQWPWQSFGRPFCYIARDSSCITITRVDILENREIEQ